jgi:hypothetical protein
VDPDFQKRAEERRLRMVGGTARSFAELDEASTQHWAQASHADRLRATYEAVIESWIIQGKNGAAPRFDGSTWGVLQFER